jgi:hypothetical protein
MTTETRKRPWYAKTTDTFELSDSTPYGDDTESTMAYVLDKVNPKWMGYRKVTAEQRAREMASQGLSDQEIRSVISGVFKQDVKSIKWNFTGE